MRILIALTKYASTGTGDVKTLEGKFTGMHRLRLGDWRVRLQRVPGNEIHVYSVRNRGQAY